MPKKKFIYYISFVYCLCIVSACIPPPNHSSVKCPTPPSDNITYWFGASSGEDQEKACFNALRQIASKISVDVNASFKSKQTENNNIPSYGVESILEVKTSDIHFPGYDIVKVVHFINTSCVLIKVDKKKFLKYYQDEFVQVDTLIKNKYNQMMNKYVFEILKSKDEWFSHLQKAKKMASILSSFGFDSPQKTVITKHLQYQNKMNIKLESANVFIQHIPPTQYIADYIKELLTQQNIQVVDSKTNDSSQAIMIIDGQIKQQNFGGEYLIKLSINISLKTILNRFISQKNYSVSGVSLIGFDAALQNASKTFHADAKAIGIIKFLGL